MSSLSSLDFVCCVNSQPSDDEEITKSSGVMQALCEKGCRRRRRKRTTDERIGRDLGGNSLKRSAKYLLQVLLRSL